MFKRKCPSCGAKNSKERTVCIECGAPLISEPAKLRLAHVPTEDEALIKEEAEKVTLHDLTQKKKPSLEETTLREKAKQKAQYASQRKRTWFWAGLILLSISVLWWLIFIIAVVFEPKDVVVSFVVWLLLSALPIGIGIYCVRRGRKTPAVEMQHGHEPTYTTQTAVEPAEEIQSIEQETTTAMKTMKNAGGQEILASHQVGSPIEQDSQCMVIRPTFGERFGLIFGLAFVIVWSIIAQFIPIILLGVLFSVFGILMGLLILRGFLGSKIVIDKPTQAVTINKRSFFLASRQRVIPFSDVENVVIDYEQKTSMSGPHGGTTSYDAWKVSLDIGEKVEIKNTTKKANVLYLASEISRFIGRELVDNSAKPESSFTGLFRKVKGFFRK